MPPEATNGIDIVIAAITDTVVPLVGSVFTLITSNPLLVVYVGAGLLTVGIGAFTALRGAAH